MAAAARSGSTGPPTAAAWIGTLVGVAFEETDIRIKGANSAIGTAYSDVLIANGE